jgi:deazaflavin-dependent oxidoreductase (nitroreductase family)
MWFNPIIEWLLRSPFHSFVSKNMMLITYIGRKSGKKYTTPVNYLNMVQDGDQFLATTSIRERTWWRNLRDRKPFTVRLQGKDYSAASDVIEDEQGVIENLAAYFQQWPDGAKYFEVGIDSEGQPKIEDLSRVAKTRVFIKTYLS